MSIEAMLPSSSGELLAQLKCKALRRMAGILKVMNQHKRLSDLDRFSLAGSKGPGGSV